MPIYALLRTSAPSQVGDVLTFVAVLTRFVLEATGSGEKTGLVGA